MIHSLKMFIQSFDVKRKYFRRLPPNGRVLELGCGRGDNWRELQIVSPEIEFHGVDILPASEVREGIHFLQLNIDEQKLPYEDNSFDGMLFTHVIEHVQNIWEIGKEIRRVLKPNGIIYIETPNWSSILVPSFGFHREQHNPFNFYDDPTHVRPWTKHSLYEFISTVSVLEVENVGTVRNWMRLQFDIVRICYGIFSGNRHKIVSAFWNLYGWCIYGIGVKK
ncbi:MAG: methyltransferase domain-containing protein [Ignavibacteriae bacterium]|nr:methyltransferase domain-containing protein [Ignavibacteriota bacterium]